MNFGGTNRSNCSSVYLKMLYEKIGGCPASHADLKRNGVRLKSQCRHPFPTPHTAHYLPGPGPSPAKPRPVANPSPSTSASETSPGLINSGLAMAAVTTTSLIGVIVLSRRHDEL